MKRNIIICILLLTISVLTFSSCANKKHTSFLPGRVWLHDNGVPINAHGGGIIYVDGVYYWYGEHKLPDRSEEEKADGGVHCYSSADLYNWKDRGLVHSVNYDEPDSDIALGCILERPKVVYNGITAKYMMYFKLYPKGQGYKYGYLGVAMSDSPAGPFTYSHKFLGADSEEGSGDFAMVNDVDGTLYHFCSTQTVQSILCGENE